MDEDDVKVIIDYLTKGIYPPGMTPNGKRCLRQKTRAFRYYDDGRLFHCGKSNRHHQLVVVNLEERQKLILESHTEPNPKPGGELVIHRGVNATIKKICARYWWKRLVEDVRTYCKNCLVCRDAAAASALGSEEFDALDIGKTENVGDTQYYNDESNGAMDDGAADSLACITDAQIPIPAPHIPAQDLIEYTSDSYGCELMSAMRELYDSRIYCDVVLLCDGYQTQAHKIMLMAASSHFRSLLVDPDLPIHDSISFPGMAGWCLDALVSYVYSGKLLLNRDNVEALMNCAGSLGISSAISLCERFLSDLQNVLFNDSKAEDEQVLQTEGVGPSDADTVIDSEAEPEQNLPTKQCRASKRKHSTDADKDEKSLSGKSLRSDKKKREIKVPLTRKQQKSTASKTTQIVPHRPITRSNSLTLKTRSVTKVNQKTNDVEKKSRNLAQATAKSSKELRRTPSLRGGLRGDNRVSAVCERLKSIMPLLKRLYYCVECRKRFPLRIQMRRHLLVHHGICSTPFSLSYWSSRVVCAMSCRSAVIGKYFSATVESRAEDSESINKVSADVSAAEDSSIVSAQTLIEGEKATEMASKRLQRCRHCKFSCVLKSRLSAHVLNKHRRIFNRSGSIVRRFNAVQYIAKTLNCIKSEALDTEADTKKPVVSKKSKHTARKYQRREQKTSVASEPAPVFIRCGWCGTMYRNRMELLAHRRLVHQPRVKPNGPAMDSHGQPVPRSWICVEKGCGAVVKTKDQMRDHMTKTHPGIVYWCPSCRFRTQIDQILRRHLVRRHKERHICQECGKAYHKPFLLRIHMFNKHRRSDPLLKLHKCKYEDCSYVCPSKNGMTMHLLKHNQGSQFTCSSCGKSFKRENGLEKHFNKVHLGIKPWVCDKCGDAFADEPELRNHMNRHADSKPYCCKLCPFSTFQGGSLKSHMFTRHQIIVDHKMSVLRCDQCSFTTDKRCRFNDHIKMHRNIRDIPCPDCSKMFITKKTLRQHIVKVHMRSTKAAIAASTAAVSAAAAAAAGRGQHIASIENYLPENVKTVKIDNESTGGLIPPDHMSHNITSSAHNTLLIQSHSSAYIQQQQHQQQLLTQLTVLDGHPVGIPMEAHQQLLSHAHPLQPQHLISELQKQMLIPSSAQLQFDINPHQLLLMQQQQQIELGSQQQQQLIQLEKQQQHQIKLETQQQNQIKLETQQQQIKLDSQQQQQQQQIKRLGTQQQLVDAIATLQQQQQQDVTELTVLTTSSYQQ